jgi:mono/diheme cytochrome c family protein
MSVVTDGPALPGSKRIGLRALVLAAIVLLVVLDLGRSLYARLGYLTPGAVWAGGAYDVDYPWPPGVQTPPGAGAGERLYVRYCSMCHGLKGNGYGAAAGNMQPTPRDFSAGIFRYKSTAAQAPPTDADLLDVVANGLDGGAMPYFADLMTDEEMVAVVAYLKTLAAPYFDRPGAEPIEVPARMAPDADSLARGAALYASSCEGCHGKDGRAQVAGARDLSAPWTFRGGSDPERLWLRVTTGLAGTVMPPFADALTPDQRWDVVNHVLGLARAAPWEAGGALQGRGQSPDPQVRGEYLVRAQTCTYCHTESILPMLYNNDRFLGGGAATRSYPDGTVISPNITPDPETGIGGWSEQQIVAALRTGRAPGRSLDLSFKPWMFFRYSDEDAAAIARYLLALPPTAYRVAEPLRYGVIETVLAKLVRLPMVASAQFRIPIPTGPFGESAPGWLPWDWPQKLLVGAQWLVLAVAGVAVVVVLSRRRSPLLTAAVVLGLGSIGVGMAAVYDLYAFVPRERLIDIVQRTIPRPDDAHLQGDAHRRMVERGRYLYTVSCAMCHQLDGGGGDHLTDPYAGSMGVRNISPNIEHGIGRWSEREIARAIRSGITPQGQILFWGFMPWDMFSNLAEEDVRALVAYLRALPAVDVEPPPRMAPPADHPMEITWTMNTTRLLELLARASPR